MRKFNLLLALGLILVANAVVLIGVAVNRSGSASTSISLTERELRIAPMEEENTGLFLRLQWDGSAVRYPHEYDDGPGWFDTAKLGDLGFDCRVPLEHPEAEAYYRNLPEREAFVALELEGRSWQRWISQREKEVGDLETRVERQEATAEQLRVARERLERDRLSHTRLFAVDVSRDDVALREKYPDRGQFLITRCIVALRHERMSDGSRREGSSPGYLRGVVAYPIIRELNVPLPHRRVFEPFLPDPRGLESAGPRYRVNLHYGSRYEPWIADVEILDSKAPSGPGRS